MNEQETPLPTASKKRYLLPVSIAAFALSAGFSGYVKYASYATAERTAEIRRELSEYESKIGLLRADPSVAAADLMNRNKAGIESDVSKSEAQKYVSELMRLHRDYEVDFDGFSYSNGKIATIVSSRQTSPGVDPVDKIVRLIGDYRSGSGSAASSPLSLGDVRLVSGDDTRRNFSIEFKVK